MHTYEFICVFTCICASAVNSILQDGLADADSLSGSDSSGIEPLPGLETILEELQKEDGYVHYF